MIEIRLHEEIDNASNAWIYRWLGMDEPFSLETLQRVMDEHPGEGLRIQIHCVGGSVTEGFAIYDALRTSGREIECNVEGDCHSMAIVILLAAPKDKRTAMPNSSFLIHEVSGGVEGNLSAVENYVEAMRDFQNRILDIFAERTGWDRNDLEIIMKEEKVRDAKFMLEHGFIGAITEYNTNKKGNMKLNEIKDKAIEALSSLFDKAEKEPLDAVQEAAPKNEIEALNNRIAEMQAEKDNMQAMVDALTVERDELSNKATEKDGQIADLNEQVSNLNSEKEEMTNKVATLEAENKAKDEEINNLKSQLGSNYQPGNRMNGQPAGEQKKEGGVTNEERLNECREKLGWNKKK